MSNTEYKDPESDKKEEDSNAQRKNKKVKQELQTATVSETSFSDGRAAITSSGAREYDREEPVTTKNVKTLKKRPKKMQDLSDSESWSSLENLTEEKRRKAITNVEKNTQNMETTFVSISEESSLVLSLSTSELNLNSSNPDEKKTDEVPAEHNLGSGIAFIYMVIPPDGGWGWFILVISFLAQVIVDGIIFTVGVLLPHMAKEFGVRESQIILVAAIQVGCHFSSGTFSTALINLFGFRPVAMLGVCIASVSLCGASYCTNFSAMVICYSVIAALGLSMIWASSQLIIGYYFEQYRPLANGFACSGSGAGMVIFSIMNKYLVTDIGWRNTTRVHCGILLLIFFMAIAYIEVKPRPVGVVHKSVTDVSSSSEYYGTVYNFLRDTETVKAHVSILEYYYPDREKRKCCHRCAASCCKCCKCCRHRHRRHHDSESHLTEKDNNNNYVVRREPLQRQDLFYTGRAEYSERHSHETVVGKDMRLMGSEKHMLSTAYGLSRIHEYGSFERQERQRSQKVRQSKRCKRCCHKMSPASWVHPKIRRAFGLLFDFRLLANFEFRFLVASAFFYPMGFNIPFVYAAQRTNIPPDYAMYIAPSIGLMNFTMRIVCGFIAYKYKPHTTFICGFGLVFGGSAVLLSAFYGTNEIWFQFFYGLCYGVAPAVYSTLRAILYVRFLGLKNLTKAFGITALAMGLGVFMGTSIAGLMIEISASYTASFAFAGLCIIISGSIILLLPFLLRYKSKKEVNPSETEAQENSKHVKSRA